MKKLMEKIKWFILATVMPELVKRDKLIEALEMQVAGLQTSVHNLDIDLSDTADDLKDLRYNFEDLEIPGDAEFREWLRELL